MFERDLSSAEFGQAEEGADASCNQDHNRFDVYGTVECSRKLATERTVKIASPDQQSDTRYQ